MSTASYSLASGVIHRQMEGMCFVITPDSTLHVLREPTSVRIFEIISENPSASTDQLVCQITAEFDVASDVARMDIQEFLAQLVTKGIIVPSVS